nr:hypothetical protein [Streptomyces sp. SAI-208]
MPDDAQESSTNEPPTPVEPARQRLGPATTDGLRAYPAKTRESGDQLVAVLKDIPFRGLPSVEDCTP